ncbi:2-C-methyl-D-erythritol 4-phosphate cytidylyltransferase [Clostridium thermosuccinogenes]|uniref:2-C-methyl-D-erythritol 4-phosphate cytidylyltransferase n=1 Tax=Clostridium thermosuccinogenes TaxID=84032 RepID=A0A2K2FI06_9CLOT|nr:2-C-methyl-D-erythritol 4-phosphate cytidylyltransferase [Pseudoclostridium thermosuccinogenes]AUS95583.1 2-C-methyl-D-erythritol 4-phosphate cytidylyltransferase [Pseudoclostridium thermosuccinogenes]PNT98400.1 2-C-methyl-D-erythritol 4-phosphate cytidylyltransferase [Pseudoclostridium thermosuccinogenes]PNU00468.1 2-C-methyl-D-erythritol 4-phosphate cytidylyltransferase [Pseudoclostridium thermosuccinogenes]
MKKSKEVLVSAVVVAAGKGTRMHMDKNKQYIEIGEVPVLARTLLTLQKCGRVSEIIVVVNSQDIVYCKQEIIDGYGLYKVKKIVAGGETRQNSVYNGLLDVSQNCEIVLIHDGARPFVREESIEESITAALEHGASCVAVPSKDTIKSADENGFVSGTLDRKALWMTQTPQTFRYQLIMDAHKKAIDDGFDGTDDAVLVERLGFPIKLVMGSYDNIKITTQEDLILGEAIADSREYYG